MAFFVGNIGYKFKETSKSQDWLNSSCDRLVYKSLIQNHLQNYSSKSNKNLTMYSKKGMNMKTVARYAADVSTF